MIQAIAKHRKISMSPRKARLVANLIRHMRVQEALDTLTHMPQKAAPYISKLLRSAVANLTQQQGASQKTLPSALHIRAIYVDGGKVVKRIRPAPQGRAHPIRKPSCHITVVVGTQKLSKSDKPSSKAIFKDLLEKEQVNPLSQQVSMPTQSNRTKATT